MARITGKEARQMKAAYLRGYDDGAGNVASFVRDCQPDGVLTLQVRLYANSIVIHKRAAIDAAIRAERKPKEQP